MNSDYFINKDKDKVKIYQSKDVISSKTNAYSTISQAQERLRPEVWPEVNARFDVGESAKIFTIGSCFARNIEDNLDRLGYKLPTRDFKDEKVIGIAATLLNKYTPASIYQEILWTYNIYKRDDVVRQEDVDLVSFEDSPSKFLDLHVPTNETVSEEYLFDRRKRIYDIFRQVFEADVVTLTLGLIEAWRYKTKDLFIQMAPGTRGMRRKHEEFEFCQLTYPVCLAYIEKTIELIREFNDCKFLITTSPVTLAKTFTDMDVITANLESKSVLRAVCGQICRSYDYVGYFPSFESAILTKDSEVFLEDNVHIAPAFVGKLVGRLVDTYFSGASGVGKKTQEAFILSNEGKWSDAAELLLPYYEDESISLIGSISLAQWLIKDKKQELAEKVLLVQIERGVEDGNLFHHMRAVCIGLQSYERALEFAVKASKLNPHHWSWKLDIANILFMLERYVEAESYYLRLRDKLERYTHKVQYAQILNALGKTEEAKAQLLPVPLGEENVNMFIQSGKLLKQMGDYEKARDVLELGKSNFPSDPRFDLFLAEMV